MTYKCKYFLWDCDWYYCDLLGKETDPNKCLNCNDYIEKECDKE